MKANRSRIAAALALPLALGLAASCSEQRVEPTPMPTPTPSPAPAPPPEPKQDWREAEITPGDWHWAIEGGKSVATFADGLLKLRCDQRGAALSILRRGSAEGRVPMTVVTQYGARALDGAAIDGSIGVALPARDPLFDQMAFSRGRFAVEVSGLPTLYVPSWPEVSRVIEDCR